MAKMMHGKRYNLVLYQYDSCPFCAMVRNYLEQNNVRVPMKDTLMDPAARRELIQIGGKAQVPCLTINGAPLYESRDIIEWVRENIVELKPIPSV
ncbi:MAG: glutaredoxin [Chloroflexota bacterium]